VSTLSLHIESTDSMITATHAIRVYNFKKVNFEVFTELLRNISWHTCFLMNSIEDAWSMFKDLLFSAANECIPKIMIRNNKR